MSIRQKVNSSPVFVVGVVVLAVGIAVYMFMRSASTGATLSTETYYTVDDGKTFFSGPLSNIPPYMHEGKEAVKAYVFECDGKQFVGYMSKMSEKAKAAIDKYRADAAKKPEQRPDSFNDYQAAIMSGSMYKKPGDKEWKSAGPGYRVDVKCDDGKPAKLIEK